VSLRSIVLSFAVPVTVFSSLPWRVQTQESPPPTGRSSKAILTDAAAARWKSIDDPLLTPDGQWVAYVLNSQGADTLVVRATRDSREHRLALGENPRSPRLTANGQFLVVEADARGQDTGGTSLPRFRVLALATGTVTPLARATAVTVPQDNSRYLFYLAERDGSARDSAAASAPASAERRGALLVIRDLWSGVEVRLEDVDVYAIDASARWLLYAVASATPARDGLYLRELVTGRTRPVLTGAGRYTGLTFDASGAQIAFLASRGEPSRSEPVPDTPRIGLYYATVKAPAGVQLVAPNAFGPDSALMSSTGLPPVTFSVNGAVLRFSVTAIQRAQAPAADDEPVFELWRYNDPLLVSQQKTMRSFGSAVVYDLAARKLLRLGEATPESPIQLSADGRHALLRDVTPYAIPASWGDERNDLYVLDVRTGTRSKLATGQRYQPVPAFSPSQKYVYWWNAGNWYTYSLATRKTVVLTACAPGVRFDMGINGEAGPAGPWGNGVAGWTAGDRRVLVYEQFDIWALDPDGIQAPRVLTDSVGRRERIRFRLLPVDTGGSVDGSLNPARSLWLDARDMKTQAEGFYRVSLDGKTPLERVVMADVRFGPRYTTWLVKARDADVYLTAKQNASTFPDLWVGPSPAALMRLTDANPQQQEYRWPTAEMVRWRSDDGVALQGVLFKPEDFDSARQYPMVVTYYQGGAAGYLHSYSPPGASGTLWNGGFLNPSEYASNGYLVFVPDIVYTLGEPGASAVKSIMPGVHALLQRGFVKPDGVGCAGISWGGYQTFQLVTHTRLFAGCFAQAGTSDFLSGYLSLGHTRNWSAWIYEFSQSRMGGHPWQYRERYLENSPVWYLDRVTTPLLIVHNDQDEQVPWTQGLAVFLGLRRLDKEAYFLNYPGEGHGVRTPANVRDLNQRVFEFFETKLNGKPAPAWMVKGVPYTPQGGAR
jgi:dipeptidyl aminopeptidase/acylaminoacyl peptidase